MTFVDRGAIQLDDDIAKWLPEFTGSRPPITARQLLDHTSGVAGQPLSGRRARRLATCVQTLRVVAPRSSPRGGIAVLVRQCAVAGGRSAQSRCSVAPTSPPSWVRRLHRGPLAMNDTTWPGAARTRRTRRSGRARDGRRLRQVARHDPPRREGERDRGCCRRTRVHQDDLESGGGVRHPRATTPSASRRSRATASVAGPNVQDQSGTTAGREPATAAWVSIRGSDFTTRHLGDRRRAGRTRRRSSQCRPSQTVEVEARHRRRRLSAARGFGNPLRSAEGNARSRSARSSSVEVQVRGRHGFCRTCSGFPASGIATTSFVA